MNGVKRAFDHSAFDNSRMGAFARAASVAHEKPMPDYSALWRWSIEHPEQFWSHVWDWFDVPTSTLYTSVLEGSLPRASWFNGAKMNYADLVLRHADLPGAAVIAVADDGARTELTWAELVQQVRAFAATLRRLGVAPGDHVAGYITAGVEAVVAFLGSASVGATWAACGPDYGALAAKNRLAPLCPTVLVATTGYAYGGRVFDRREVVREIVSSLGNATVVEVPRLGLHLEEADLVWGEAIRAPGAREVTEQVDANHPLWVLFSSGTTGIPKGIVHGHAGVACVHLAALGLHFDLGAGDRLFWNTTTNWMMWNFAVSCLLVGATLVTYEGSPGSPVDRLWAIAAEEQVDVLGVSPGYLQACANERVHPGSDHDLARLRVLGVTGSPLPPAIHEWVSEHVSSTLPVASTSGGTDVVTGFLGWAPGLPTRAGELAAPLLGVAVDVWDTAGRPVMEEVGELVVTQPLPSMPVRFFNDPTGELYAASYFDSYPDTWRQGDWATRHRHGGFTLHGRSDSTLNRGGVRIGSADLYAIVEARPEVAEALVLGIEQPDGGYRMPMFLVPANGHSLTEDVIAGIISALRTQGSPRHVPDEFLVVSAIPHTKTGKKLEVPLKRILQGADPASVLSPGAVDDPSLIDPYVAMAAEWRA